jgi:hypothetical protein
VVWKVKILIKFCRCLQEFEAVLAKADCCTKLLREYENNEMSIESEMKSSLAHMKLQSV